MNRSLWRCVGVVALVLVAGLGALAEHCTITVQPGESIQAAIDAAPEGAVICLTEGEWEERLDIGKSLTLRGAEGGTVIRGHEEEWAVIHVSTPGEDGVLVFLDNLTVAAGSEWRVLLIGGYAQVEITSSSIERSVEIRAQNNDGVYIQQSAQVTIRDSIIAGNDSAVFVSDDAQVAIRDSTIAGNGRGVYVLGWRSGSDAHVTITGSTIEGNRLGIEASGESAQVTITDSRIEGNMGNGISAVRSAQVTIRDSTIVGNWVGMRVADSAKATITGSTIAGNEGHGIRIENSAQVTIEQCQIARNNGFGIYLPEPPCVALPHSRMFAGYITGFGNAIPGPDEEGGNKNGAVCPDELGFLMTEEGGELDRRE